MNSSQEIYLMNKETYDANRGKIYLLLKNSRKYIAGLINQYLILLAKIQKL